MGYFLAEAVILRKSLPYTFEENFLSFERFPYTAVIKTYNTNQQTPDSAGTMTAIVSGVKTKAEVLGVNQNVTPGDYKTVAGAKVATILELAEGAGLSTGVVSTSRLTHATPAACYAHTAHRDWEDDDLLPAEAKAAGFPDIARQLIEFPIGNGIEVAFGGGRRNFMPKTGRDPEDIPLNGRRADGRDLTVEWTKKPRSAYIWNQEQFKALDANSVDHVLGLFDYDHMEYEHDRLKDTAGEPSLTEMTVKAIEILGRNEKGYFLMVEGARIDHGHHAGNAFRALTDTIEFARAVQAAIDRSKRDDTLIVVTADHSHVFTLGGYATRGNPILGKVVGNDEQGTRAGLAKDSTKLPYTSLMYANGPGYVGESEIQQEGPKRFPHLGLGFKLATKGRPDLKSVDTEQPDYLQECALPLSSETHGGEDVIVYADGPMAHLFRGVQEQNYIFHVMIHALNLEAP